MAGVKAATARTGHKPVFINHRASSCSGAWNSAARRHEVIDVRVGQAQYELSRAPEFDRTIVNDNPRHRHPPGPQPGGGVR